MKAFSVGLLLFVPLLGHGSESFTDAFFAYAKIQKSQEELSLLKLKPENDSLEGSTREKEVAAALTEARIQYQAVLRSDQSHLAPWEKDILKRVEAKKPAPAKVDQEALTFLGSLSQAKEFSTLEWAVVQEWFGRPSQEEFLKQTYSFSELPELTLPEGSREDVKVVWVLDPFRRMLESPDSLEKKDLDKVAPKAETLEVSAFSTVDEQAEELRHSLLSRGSEPYVLISNGDGSAVVHKMLDLYPSMRSRPEIKGWINAGGRLYGRRAEERPGSAKGRSIASVKVETQKNAAWHGLILLREDAIERAPPLGKGFPILNIISLDEKFRPAVNLRESLVVDGNSWYVTKGSAWSKAASAIPLLGR